MNTEPALAALSALAHPGRLDLFRLLVRAGENGMGVTQIAESCGQRLTTVSAQLGQLAQAGVVASERDGRTITYRADFAAITALLAFLLEDCCGGRPEVVGPLTAFLTQSACCPPLKGTQP